MCVPEEFLSEMEVEVSTEDMGQVVEDSQSTLQQADLQKKKRGSARRDSLKHIYVHTHSQARRANLGENIPKNNSASPAHSRVCVCVSAVDIETEISLQDGNPSCPGRAATAPWISFTRGNQGRARVRLFTFDFCRRTPTPAIRNKREKKTTRQRRSHECKKRAASERREHRP